VALAIPTALLHLAEVEDAAVEPLSLPLPQACSGITPGTWLAVLVCGSGFWLLFIGITSMIIRTVPSA
jgi:hypothetical protein